MADRLELILAGMEKVTFQQTKIPLWSATTLQPYPANQQAIRQLSAEHLVQPVRFRELTEKLYEEGARFFIQVGTGGLTGFIDDTLKGKTFSTLASSVTSRSALAQLQRVVAALFVEGKTVPLDFQSSVLPAPDGAPHFSLAKQGDVRNCKFIIELG